MRISDWSSDVCSSDLSGGGRDAVELLRRGWSVLALDAAPEAAVALWNRPDLPRSGALVTRTARFEDARWPAADLVNASFSLPLCPTARFHDLWTSVRASLSAVGRFEGAVSGQREGLTSCQAMSCPTRTQRT